MEYKLELHLVMTGPSKEALAQWHMDLVDNLDDISALPGEEYTYELTGGLVEITDGEKDSEGVSDGE